MVERGNDHRDALVADDRRPGDDVLLDRTPAAETVRPGEQRPVSGPSSATPAGRR